MATTLTGDDIANITSALTSAMDEFQLVHPGEVETRQPVHTVYGGAQLFRATTPKRMGELALAALERHAPDVASLAAALQWDDFLTADASEIYQRVLDKLTSEPVEDFRIDFEDGFGFRPDDEEDAEATRTAGEVADALEAGLLPPFIGIRIKPLSRELASRSLRTLDLFVSELVGRTGGALPSGFVVTLPKVVTAAQVTALCDLLDRIEGRLSLANMSIPIELMVETPQSIFAADGRAHLPDLVAAARGRCRGLHFGTYDYTALCNITAAHQDMQHPACDFAKHMMQVSMAQRGLMLSDGATNVMPVGPHRAAKGASLTPEQARENDEVVHNAWRLQQRHVRHSLTTGYYQGWDLHPAQLPIRYATVYAFFRESLDQASLRLRTFIEQAAKATLVGDVFDDAATGQGLLNYFLRARNCGAIGEAEVRATGLTEDDLATRSFPAILKRLA